ncbi:MAG: Sjogren's syndrome/scleroderma autoantigen 1 family protein [Candidatus Bathyarchaeota archaeon]
MSKDSNNIKVMADLLRQGSTLTGHSCPVCFSPLFEIKGRGLWCVSCQKQVKILKEGEVDNQNYQPTNFSSLESTILSKIENIEKQLSEETDSEKLKTLGTTLSILLENLEKIRKIKNP